MNTFNVKQDFVSSFRLDIEINQIFMTVGIESNHLEIPLPKEFTNEFIELNKVLEAKKVELYEALVSTQLMLSTHGFCKAIQALETTPRGTK